MAAITKFSDTVINVDQLDTISNGMLLCTRMAKCGCPKLTMNVSSLFNFNETA